MMLPGQEPLVTTIKERCRMCYACVRECPAEAIRILEGQASVIQERCIGCGNCVYVCGQKAKEVMSHLAAVEELLRSPAPVAAIVAPSFPAEFTDCDAGALVGSLRDLGFDYVHEVAFGADLVAREYARLLERGDGQRYVATTCPAVVSFVRKYHPDLLGSLAPIVSPMIATARMLHAKHGSDAKIVFIGPCIAKKGEAAYEQLRGEVDAVLTYVELRDLFLAHGVDPASRAADGGFDAPRGSLGGLFPITRGLLQAANLQEDLLEGDIVSADGRRNFTLAIEDFESGETDARLLDILCCQGCIMGAGFTHDDPIFKRRSHVSKQAKTAQATFDDGGWEQAMKQYDGLDLRRTFEAYDQRLDDLPSADELKEILARMNKFSDDDLLDCGACGYETCNDHAVAIYRGLAEVEMCLPAMVDQLRDTISELERSHRNLETTKEALVKSEKLASMGQLAAGIAHEVNNPLGILLLQANILLEEVEEDAELRDDLTLIVDQANRCKKIISGLLNFARQSRVVRQPTDIPALVDEVLSTLPLAENVAVKVENAMTDPVAEVDADQIVQVMVNLITNAQQAMPEGGMLRIGMSGEDESIVIVVTDTGCGIPKENVAKLFDPFFTTKQVGKGTGLGLAVTHGIVKMHRGSIDVESNADPAKGPTETTFIIKLPRHEL